MAAQAHAYIAGGVEMMGRVAMGSDGAAIAVDPSLAMKTYFVPQGISADIIATEYGFSRDDADALAVESQKRAAQAWAENRFAKSIVPVKDQNGLTILDRDEYMRPGTDMQTLGKLDPAFKGMGEVMPGFDKLALMKYPHLERIHHIHHAGNSSGIVDGAAALLIGNAEFGKAHGLKPRAKIRATAKIGTDPTIMLTGPVPVTEKILRDSGMSIRDIDLFEVNEAFASVVLRFCQAFDVDASKVNVNGGSIAMGHPLGATGAMIIGTLLDELGAHRQGHRPRHPLRGQRHGCRHDHRAGLTPPPLSPPHEGEGKRPVRQRQGETRTTPSRRLPPPLWGRAGQRGQTRRIPCPSSTNRNAR